MGKKSKPQHKLKDESGRQPDVSPGRSVFLRGPWPAVLLTICLLAPFINKAYHIDDTVYLYEARQIRQDPLHPYHAIYSWYTSPQTSWINNNNPPLNAYLLAAVGAVADEKEWVCHLFYFLLAGGSAALMFLIARRFCRHPNLATMLTLASPAIFVSAGNVMTDVPLLFFWLAAVFFTIEAAEEADFSKLWWAGFAAAAAAMTKYFGIAVVPLLILFWFVRTRRFSVHLLAFLLPLLILFLWNWYSKVQYGSFHFFAAAKQSTGSARDIPVTIANTLAFLGGTLIWPIALVPLVFRINWKAAAAGAGIFVLICALNVKKIPDPVLVYWLVMTLGGAMLISVAVDSCRRRPDSHSVLLAAWLFGTLSFVMFFNWTVSARVIIPAVFPAALLAVRRIESSNGPGWWKDWAWGSVGLAAGVSFLLALVDYDFAGAGRTFAQTSARELLKTNSRVFFSGHWGFQYYMEREGAVAFNYRNQDILEGDLIVYPGNNTNLKPIKIGMTKISERLFPNPWPLQIHRSIGGVSFNSTLWGPVPFSDKQDDFVDRFFVFRVDLKNRETLERENQN